MSDIQALALLLANPGVQLLLWAVLAIAVLLLAGAVMVLSSDKLSRNLARVLRGSRGKK